MLRPRTEGGNKIVNTSVVRLKTRFRRRTADLHLLVAMLEAV